MESFKQQDFVYLVSHCFELTSNAIFYTLEEAYKYIDNRVIYLNKDVPIDSPEYVDKETFYIYKVYIGQSFEGEIFEDGLEIIQDTD